LHPSVRLAVSDVTDARKGTDTGPRTHYGSTCAAYGFNFGVVYGELAKGFIHVHHIKQLSEIGEEYEVDPIADLRPVCPNCHEVLHLGGKCRTIEEAKSLLEAAAR
jgi:predicted HNH restriction endonuclease